MATGSRKRIAFLDDVSKEQIGLPNVDNTSDMDKPVSTAQQAALDKKTNTTDFNAHTDSTTNPHAVTKAQVGLGNVEDKSSATIRSEITAENISTALGYTPPTADTATKAVNGLMSKEDKDKLDGVDVGANKIIVDEVLDKDSTNPVTNSIVYSIDLNIKTHKNNTENPHSVTAAQVGSYTKAESDTNISTALGSAKSYTDTKIADLINSAPETLDTLGEIATAIKTNETVVEALNEAVGTKAKASDLTAHTSDTANPHSVTKSQVGLGNVENKSSATIRSELTKEDVTNALGYTPPTTNTTYAVVTDKDNGLMSAADKVKLDGVAANANNYTHPSSHAATMITQDASHRFVTDTEKSTWNNKASTATATTSANGLMSSTDKTKLTNMKDIRTISSPLSFSGTTLSIPAATTSVNGYMTTTQVTKLNKAPIKYTTTIGDGSTKTFTITHGIGNKYVQITAVDSSGRNLWLNYTLTSTTQATITFDTAPASSSVTVIVIG